VAPPAAPDDDPARFGRYGVRVPALVVSPWVEQRSVAMRDCERILFDHTSLAKTILLRFCPQALGEGERGVGALLHPGAPHPVGTRTAQAEHLGAVLTQSEPRPAPDRRALLEAAAKRRGDAARRLLLEPLELDRNPRPLTDLQVRIANAANHLRAHGLPPGQP
jgi:phospholipase C